MARKPQTVTVLPDLVSIDDSAGYLGVTPMTIRRWIASGRLPASKLGPRMVRIRRDDLEALLTPIPAGEVG